MKSFTITVAGHACFAILSNRDGGQEDEKSRHVFESTAQRMAGGHFPQERLLMQKFL